MDISPAFLGLGAVLLFFGAGVFLLGINKKWGVLFPYMGMLLFASLSMPLDWNDRVIPTVWLPVQQKRSTLFFIMGIVTLLMTLFQIGRLRGKAISISALLLVTMGFYAALMRFMHEGALEGTNSVIFAACTLIPMMFVTALSIKEPTDLLLFLRSVVLMNIAWMAMCSVQLVVNPKYLTLGNQFRFVGVLNNPQHSGAMLAFFCVIVLWLLFNDVSKKYKLIYLGLLSVDLLCLVWTGSRTGLGMAIIGLCAVLYTKAGKGILMVPVAAVVIYVGMKLIVNTLGIDFGVERLASTENTRDYAWWKLYTTGMENPMFGVGTLESEKSENSWLFGFAAFGIGMLGLSILFTLAAMWECIRMIRMRFWLPGWMRPYPDLLVGMITMYFAGAVLEGYMVSRVNTTLCIYLPVATAGAMFRKFAKQYHESGYDEYDSDSDSSAESGYISDEYGDEYADYTESE